MDDHCDVRRAALLRYPFQGDTSASIWGYLLKSGWKYKAGAGYQAPNTDSWISSKEVLALLDEAAIVPIDNYLQLPPTRRTISASSEKLRSEIIDVLPIAELLKATLSTTSSKAAGFHAPMTNNLTTTNTSDATRPKRHHPSQKGKSVTAFDAGADMFLRQPKTKKQRHVTNSNPPGAKEFPTASQIADYFEQFNLEGLNNMHSMHYEEWKFLLSTNHSVLLYGFGSKRAVLEDFRRTCLEHVGDVLSIDGFDSSVHIDDVLDLMVEMFLKNKDPSTTSSGQVSIGTRAMVIGKAIANVQVERKQPLYLLIHNIDGFRCREAQHALSLLLIHSSIRDMCRTIRLVASVDHVSAAALLWDPETTFNFDFIWKEVHTYQPYIEESKRGIVETKSSLGKRTKNTSTTTSESLYEVLSTIAPRPTEVLQVLAALQLKRSSAISFRDLYAACKTKFLVTSDGTLHDYMTELLTHGLMRKSRERGEEYLEIPHSNALLDEIMDYSPSNDRA
jgi:origin recognition complex subunit 2